MDHRHPFGDYVQPFQIEAPGLRGRLVRLGSAVEATLARHLYPAPVAAMLAESLAMGAVLASGLKYDGVFTVQVQGDGPVGLVVVDVTSDGGMRGYARFDAARLAAAGPEPENPVPRLLGAGHMAFTVDQGPDTERYQGITPLEGATLGDCAHAYFRRSEQMETAIALCASDMAVAAPRAAALMLQRLPASGLAALEAEDDWRRAVVMMSSVTTGELLDPALSAADILYRLFHEDGVRVFTPRPLRHQCRCSRGKVERTLRAFAADEIRAMAEDGRLTVTCEFCKTAYAFEADDLGRLWS
ncbi:MAG: Hsp33 family molecular chaperone HslO [Rhodospirillales bacterium]